MKTHQKIILPGGAGLVGQNLIVHLKRLGYRNLVVIDKHINNLNILKQLHPDILTEHADITEPGDWKEHFENADIVVMLQAQIGDLNPEPFYRNNVLSTKIIIDLIKRYNIPYTVHVSSSVVKSKADDLYTRSKSEQEKLVLESDINCVVLRPTLMFGWFDRKHLGWLKRFMEKTPIFPIPGNGKYMRQPLYAGDFSNVIVSCIENRISGKIFNISGLERINYIDIIREIKRATKSRTLIFKIPYSLFYFLLKFWSLLDKAPPFTTDQLAALVTDDEFEEIDWPSIFDIKMTPFREAIEKTFNDPEYGKITLKF